VGIAGDVDEQDRVLDARDVEPSNPATGHPAAAIPARASSQMTRPKIEILVVDDEPLSARALKNCLERRGEFCVEVAHRGRDALRDLVRFVPQALLLAATIPDLSTRELCRLVRSRPRFASLPIIVLGERANGIGLIDALEVGADDYVAKPLNERELEARLKALLRRRALAPPTASDRFRGVHLDVDFADVMVAVDDKFIRLTRRELHLLRCLVHNRNRAVGRDVLLANGCPKKGQDAGVVDSVIDNLKAKLCEAGRQIEVVSGVGYRFIEPPEDGGSVEPRI
jgi:DNA-binding response OmpR family regulator